MKPNTIANIIVFFGWIPTVVVYGFWIFLILGIFGGHNMDHYWNMLGSEPSKRTWFVHTLWIAPGVTLLSYCAGTGVYAIMGYIQDERKSRR